MEGKSVEELRRLLKEAEIAEELAELRAKSIRLSDLLAVLNKLPPDTLLVGSVDGVRYPHEDLDSLSSYFAYSVEQNILYICDIGYSGIPDEALTPDGILSHFGG